MTSTAVRVTSDQVAAARALRRLRGAADTPSAVSKIADADTAVRPPTTRTVYVPVHDAAGEASGFADDSTTRRADSSRAPTDQHLGIKQVVGHWWRIAAQTLDDDEATPEPAHLAQHLDRARDIYCWTLNREQFAAGPVGDAGSGLAWMRPEYVTSFDSGNEVASGRYLVLFASDRLMSTVQPDDVTEQFSTSATRRRHPSD